MEVQKWIVGKKIAKDEESLESLGVKSDGSSIFLYLMKNESAGLTRDMFATMLAEGEIHKDNNNNNNNNWILYSAIPSIKCSKALHIVIV